MRKLRIAMLAAAMCLAGMAACSKVVSDGERILPDTTLTRAVPDRTYFRDGHGRYVYLNGVNVSGTSKLPVAPDPLADPRGTPVSFVGRPFPSDQVDEWMRRIRDDYGFNSIRLVIMWEAVEHEGRGKYDTDYLDYIENVVRSANEHGIYVLLNFHENLFSRFFYSSFSRDPALGEPGSIEYMLSSLFPDQKTLDYDGRITGDGAPRWAVEACVPEKKLDSPNWGMNHILGPLGDPFMSFQLFYYLDKLLGTVDLGGGGSGGGEGGGEAPPSLEDWLLDMVALLKAQAPPRLPFDATQSADVYPFTNWWNNVEFSFDIERCYAAFYAGDAVFPDRTFDVGGKEMNLKDYLQEAYAGSWAQVVKRVKKFDNVIGYDLVNEPPGAFIVLMASAIYIGAGFDPDAVEDWLGALLGEDLGTSVARTLFILNILPAIPSRDFFDLYVDGNPGEYNAFVKDHPELCAEALEAEKPECLQEAFYEDYVARYKEMRGLAGMNTGGALDLNLSFVVKLVDLYRRVGMAILAEDPEAVIWLEEGGGAFDDLLGGAVGSVNLYKPGELKKIVFTPHWYPDIYPFLGFNEPPRDFVVEEWMVRDFTPDIEAKVKASTETFGPVPVVFGEFGTYFNYNGIEASLASDYEISSEILNNYYESFEKLFLHRMLWNLSADNTKENGDGWNYEDFSIVGPDLAPRSELAWCRPTPLAMSGKPVAVSFNSDFHYYDPEKGIPDPWREFHLSFESKESDMPTEIFVPEYQYPDGFYVWLSDGWALYDHARHTLYFYPTRDEPGWVHEVTIRPPQPNAERTGWSYFFKGEQSLAGNKG
jgi:hypothetical protein